MFNSCCILLLTHHLMWVPTADPQSSQYYFAGCATRDFLPPDTNISTYASGAGSYSQAVRTATGVPFFAVSLASNSSGVFSRFTGVPMTPLSLTPSGCTNLCPDDSTKFCGNFTNATSRVWAVYTTGNGGRGYHQL